jgi:signal transduction histidine kinase
MKISTIKSFALYIVIMIASICNAQNNSVIDSLIKKSEFASLDEKASILNQIAEQYINTSPEKAETYANEALNLAGKSRKPLEEAKSLKIKSTLYLNKYVYSDAVEAAKDALNIYLKQEKIKEASSLYNSIGNIYKQQLEYEKALENYNKAFDHYKLIKDSSGIAATYSFIGSLFLKQTNYKKALENYTTSLGMRMRLKDTASIAASHYNIADVLRLTGDYDQAIKHLEAALNLYKLSNNLSEEAKVLNLMGSTYLKKNDNNKAIEFYQKSLEIREKLGVKKEIAKSYSNLGLAYKEQSNYQKSLDYFYRALNLQKEMGDNKDIANSLNYIGGLYYKTKDYSKALENYLLSLKKSLELEEKVETAAAYTNIGNIYYDLSSYEKSMEYFSEALVISVNIKDDDRLANLYVLIGNSYTKLKKYNDALESYKNALSLRKKLGEMAMIANVLNNIGSTYSDMGDFNKALNYYNEALSIRKKIEDKTGTSISLNNIGNLYATAGKNDLALNYFSQSIKAAEEIDFKYNIALCSRKIAEIYMQQKNYEQALLLFEKSLNLGIELANLELQKKAYMGLYSYFTQIQNYKKALENYVAFTVISDSMDVSMTNKKLLDLQVNFELNKKENELNSYRNDIASLKKQKQIDELNAGRRKQTIFILLIVTLFLLSIGILYYNRYQLKLRASQLLQDKFNIIEETNETLKKSEDELLRLNNTKDKFFSIMAHDIKNPLGGLINITDLMKTDFKDLSDEEKLETFVVINKSAHQLYALLENLLNWSRSQTGKIEFKPVPLKPFELAEANIELQKANIEGKRIMVLNMIDQNTEILADKDMLTLVMRNLLSKAVKFTNEEGKIIINAENKDGYLNISIEDNGVGMSKDDMKKLFRIDAQFTNPGTNNESGTGLGLILCKEFVNKHKGDIWVESNVGKGSKFVFSLPN